MEYVATLILTAPDGTEKKLTGTLADDTTPKYAIDFTANFRAYPPGHVMVNQDEWNDVFHEWLEAGGSVYCLEQNTDATRHDFHIAEDGVMKLFMPQGSFGMGHRSVNIRLGKVNGPVNVSYEWMCPDPGVNLWVNGGGKWGPAIQYGPIQSGSTGGIRFMPTWAGGASTLGKQDLTCSIQNQPDGGQWLQPPYYGFRPIMYNHWYNIHLRMLGGGSSTPTGPLAPGTVLCTYRKDDDPEMNYMAATNNLNAQEGIADVMIDWTCFFGGGAANCAPADCYFHYRNLRVWVEA